MRLPKGFLILILLQSTAKTSANYVLDVTPSGMCTVHLKSFQDDLSTTAIYNDIIEANFKNVLWTLWSSNDSDYVTPLIEFQEICTVNIFVEGPGLPDFEKLAFHSKETLFAFRSWKHSVYIVIRQSCDRRVTRLNFLLPHRLFIHFVNCPKYERYPVFPNTVFCGDCLVRLVGRKGSLNIHQKIPIEFWAVHHRKAIPIDFAGPLGFDSDIGDQCVKITWSVEELRSQNHIRCGLTDFILQNLMKVNNFSADYRDNLPEGISFNGMIYFSQHFADYTIYTVNGLFLIDTVHYLILYCDFTIISEQMTFSAWWSPFQVKVWAAFALGISMTSFTLAQYKEANLLNMAAWGYIGIRTVLRQEDGRKEGLLLLFSYTCLVLTSLYENTITSALIAPSAPKIVDNMINLIDLGYKVVYYKYINVDLNDTRVDEPIFFRPYQVRNVTGRFKMSDFIPEQGKFFETAEECRAIFGNPGERRAIFLQSREDFVLNILGGLEMSMDKYNCHRVTKSIGWTFDYVTIYARERDAYMNTMTTFGQAGLIGFWQELGKLQHSQQRKITFKSERSEKYIQIITLLNLVPIFAVWASLLALALVVSCMEPLYKRSI